MNVTLLSKTKDVQETIELAGRVCYRSDFEGTARLIKTLIGNKHTSVLEHASFTFKIDGISRACTHQLVRHRIASYSQESQRYVEQGACAFVEPNFDADAGDVYNAAIAHAQASYDKLRALGVAKEDARLVLPNAALSTIVVTMNCRALRHFFMLRCDKKAQAEIKSVACTMLRMCNADAPAVFGDLYEEYIN